MAEQIPKDEQDALLVIRYNMDFPLKKAVIERLVFRRYITAKHGGGWMTTYLGRAYIKRLK